MARRPRELDQSEPGKTNAPLVPDAKAPPMSFPNQSNPLAGTSQFQPQINTLDVAQPTVQAGDVSAISGAALPVNRVTKFFLPKGEVTEQEFRRAKEEAKIVNEGGRRGAATPEQLAAFAAGQAPEPEVTPTAQTPEARGQGFDVVGRLPEDAPIRRFSEATAERVSAEGKSALQLAAVALDSISSAVQSKKPFTQRQAEETFNDLATSIRADILDRNQDPTATAIKLRQAQEAIQSYENFEKDFGNLNLGHWLDDGKSTQADLIIMKEALLEMQQDLQISKQAWLQRQFIAQPTFGT